MAVPGRAVMADWLVLHGLEGADCFDLLSRRGTTDSAPRAQDPLMDEPAPWPIVLDGLRRALPPASNIVARIHAEVRVDLAPDPQRFPRAFTLHDDGRGLPYISCPVRGRISDLLVLAHELGHACQILASRTPDLPPILRETAAYLSEALVLRAISGTDPATGAILDTIHRAGTARILRQSGRELLEALSDPASPYTYDWNYPIARELAERALRHLGPEAQWGIFAGTTSLAQLMTLPRT